MPKVAKELSALQVKSIRSPGMHFVGGVPGLILQLKEPAEKHNPPSRSWILRTRLGAERLHIGLGPYPAVTLAEARVQARKHLARCRDGINPIKERKAERSALIHSSAKAKTFRECAEAYLSVHSSKFSNEKHKKQWRATLETYVYPLIGNRLVSDLTKQDVLEVLLQDVKDTSGTSIGKFWHVKTETASRVQGRLKVILDYAIISEYRPNLNPATWKGYLQTLLPAPDNIKTVQNQPAVPYAQMPCFMAQLRKSSSISAKALDFLILTAVRSGSVRQATWDEFDLKRKLWVVPAEHTKTRKEHRVPLAPKAISLLKALPRIANCPYVFPSPTLKPLSDMALSQFMRGMRERGELKVDAVPHGFRSSFRDWAADQTSYSDEIRKAASGHAVGDAVKQAYQRTDLLEKRRALMDDWADFLSGKERKNPSSGRRNGRR